MTGVIVSGMHRSGTSLTTRFLTADGWHPGEDLLVSPTERFEEDASFVTLNRSWIEATLPPGEGHRDWGISSGGPLDLASVLPAERAAMVAAARAFAERRVAERRRWVAKDPRSTLLLPIWAQVDDVDIVLVYRNPWDVVDSAVRLGAPEWTRRPQLVLESWLDHCQRILDIIDTQPERCTLIAAEALTTDPTRVWRVLDESIGVTGECPTGLVDPTKFVIRGDTSPIAALYRDIHPEVQAVLDQLDRHADVERIVSIDSGRPRPSTAATARRTAPGGTLPAGTGVQVVIPCRDDGDVLLEAIASVDAVATDAVELTIVDDGSTDPETLRVLGVLRASGQQVLTTPGVGLAAARNTALAVSRSLAVIPLDADNRLREPLIGALVYLERGEADVVHGPWHRFGLEDAVVEPPQMTLAALVPGNSIDACALIRRDVLEQLGGWDPALPFWEDWDLWLGVVGAGFRVHRLDEVTFDYLVRPGSLSSRPWVDHRARSQVVERVVTKRRRTLGLAGRRSIRRFHRADVDQPQPLDGGEVPAT